MIEKDKYYSSWKLASMNILPWKSAMTFNKRLDSKEGKKIFNPWIEKVGKRNFYKIKGEYIIKFLNSLK